MTPLLLLEDASKAFDRHVILQNINLRLAASQALHVRGNNGVGKTTLLKIMATLMPLSQGQLTLFGQPVRRHLPMAPMRQRLSLFLGNMRIVPTLTVQENLDFYRRLYREQWRADATQVCDALQLGKYSHRAAQQLSFGYRQRLELALTLAHDAALYLLDEPLDGLDLAAQSVVVQILNERLQRGASLVMVSHQGQAIEKLCTQTFDLSPVAVGSHG